MAEILTRMHTHTSTTTIILTDVFHVKLGQSVLPRLGLPVLEEKVGIRTDGAFLSPSQQRQSTEIYNMMFCQP